MPNGIPLVYKFDENMQPIKQKNCVAPLSGIWLGKKVLLLLLLLLLFLVFLLLSTKVTTYTAAIVGI